MALKEAVCYPPGSIKMFRTLRLDGIDEQVAAEIGLLADEVGLFEVLNMEVDEGVGDTAPAVTGAERQFDLTAELEEIITDDAGPAGPHVPPAPPTPPLASHTVAGEPGGCGSQDDDKDEEPDQATPGLPGVTATTISALARFYGMGYGCDLEDSADQSRSTALATSSTSRECEVVPVTSSLSSVVTMATDEPKPDGAMVVASVPGVAGAKRSKHALAVRKDAPLVRAPGKASKARGLWAGRPENRKAMLEKLRTDQVAVSTRGPKASRWKTWQEFHANWLPHEPVLPLTMRSIEAVMAQVKEARFSSAADYMSTAKSMHLQKFEWSTTLARQQTVCVRSALRGLGPRKQCEGIDLTVFVVGAKLLIDADPTKLPFNFHLTGVVAAFFMLREIELSTMLNINVKIKEEEEMVWIFLPVSKNDPMALGCWRSWGCVCVGPRSDAHPCPYHAALDQKKALAEKFGPLAAADDFPFAPTYLGETVKKDMVIKGVTEVARVSGLATHDEDGKCIRTGHAFRVEGARHLRKNGVSVPGIMCLARWNSQVVLRYLKDAPLTNITSEYVKGKVASSSAQEVSKTVKGFSDKTLNQLVALKAKADKQHAEIVELTSKITVLESITDPRYIVSDKYKKWHITLPWIDVEPSDLKTYCTWSYGFSVYQRKAKLPRFLPESSRCIRCFDLAEDGDDSS